MQYFIYAGGIIMDEEEEFENQPDCQHKKLQCSCGMYFSWAEIFHDGKKEGFKAGQSMQNICKLPEVQAALRDARKEEQESKIIPSQIPSDKAALVTDEMVNQARKETLEEAQKIVLEHPEKHLPILTDEIYKKAEFQVRLCCIEMHRELEALKNEKVKT
jgi:vacuolar-type H+-ATPase subunit H